MKPGAAMTESLPLCRLRTFQKVSIKTRELSVEEKNRSVFCSRVDHWVTVQMCLSCRVAKDCERVVVPIGNRQAWIRAECRRLAIEVLERQEK